MTARKNISIQNLTEIFIKQNPDKKRPNEETEELQK